jgi:hypothetical protein
MKTYLPLTLLILIAALAGGCATLKEEDPNSQQTPWAGPASWEGTIPGMPAPRG